MMIALEAKVKKWKFGEIVEELNGLKEAGS